MRWAKEQSGREDEDKRKEKSRIQRRDEGSLGTENRAGAGWGKGRHARGAWGSAKPTLQPLSLHLSSWGIQENWTEGWLVKTAPGWLDKPTIPTVTGGRGKRWKDGALVSHPSQSWEVEDPTAAQRGVPNAWSLTETWWFSLERALPLSDTAKSSGAVWSHPAEEGERGRVYSKGRLNMCEKTKGSHTKQSQHKQTQDKQYNLGNLEYSGGTYLF